MKRVGHCCGYTSSTQPCGGVSAHHIAGSDENGKSVIVLSDAISFSPVLRDYLFRAQNLVSRHACAPYSCKRPAFCSS